MWETKQLLVPSDFHILYVNLGLGDMNKIHISGFFGLICSIWYALGPARYHFFRTDTKNVEYLPIPISIWYLGSFL